MSTANECSFWNVVRVPWAAVFLHTIWKDGVITHKDFAMLMELWDRVRSPVAALFRKNQQADFSFRGRSFAHDR
jgi:hypothetical protein